MLGVVARLVRRQSLLLCTRYLRIRYGREVLLDTVAMRTQRNDAIVLHDAVAIQLHRNDAVDPGASLERTPSRGAPALQLTN